MGRVRCQPTGDELVKEGPRRVGKQHLADAVACSGNRWPSRAFEATERRPLILAMYSAS